MSASELLDGSISEIGAALRARKVTAVALAEEALARLDRQGRALNAVATLMPERARAEAQQADRELAQGKIRGPLHGIPYGAKDLLSATGAPTTWGTTIFKDRVIGEDATVIRKLREAGAVLVAKLSMVQLAGGFGYHRAAASLQGPGKNPWDPGRWSGGSSSGSGSAVAARCVPFAIGSETWGSILTPSSLCGVVGLRPTFGRVSRQGAMALAYSMDKLGPMARHAHDALLVLAAISGADAADPASIDAPVPSWPKKATRLKVGLVLPGDIEKQDTAIFASYRAVAEALARVADVAPAEVPAPEIPSDAIGVLTVSAEEVSAFEDLFEGGKLALLQSTDAMAAGRADRAISAAEYLRAQRLRGKLRSAYDALFSRFDAICTPALGFNCAVAPRLEDDLDQWSTGPDPFGSAGNLLGLPSVALPGPLAHGLPVAMQLVGPPWSEAALCACADALEKQNRWNLQRPS